MKVVKNKWCINLLLIIFCLLCIFLISYKNSDNQTILEYKEEISVNKKHFAMYVENEEGEFVEYTDSELFPDNSMYTFNEEKSYCVDNKDNVLENVISYSNGKVTITSSKTIYCTLYFDGDSVPPIISIDILDNYYTSARLTISSNENGTYCVNTSNIVGDISNCILQGKVIEKDAVMTYNFTTSNQYYVHVKDINGNEVVSELLDIQLLYQKVEYIENSGSQCIDTGLIPDSNTSIDITYKSIAYSGYSQYIAGARNGGSGVMEYAIGGALNGNVWYVRFNGVTTNSSFTRNDHKMRSKLLTSNNSASWILEDLEDSTSETIGIDSITVNATTNLFLFSYNKSNIHSNLIIYNCKLYDNDELVRDFVPVYRISDNVIGMFDEANKTFYTNACTGTFEKGENINYSSNSVLINDGAETTSSTNVTLTLSSNDASEMCISNTSSCDNWEAYTTSRDWTLTSGSGIKTVYVWFRDEYGNTTSYVTDTITIVCTANTALGTCINSAKTTGFNSTMEGGLYRYQGQEVDNYICFGTSNKDTCLNNTDAYIYRIIGVDSSNRVKLIKNEALENEMEWYSSDASNITWPNSTIYKNITGASFYTTTTYMPDGWNEKIDTTTWKYGDNTNENLTASALYEIENAWTDTVEAKIGLLYEHDYYYAYQSGGLNCSSSGSYSNCAKAWMNISISDPSAPYEYEWTMSRYGKYSDGYYYAYPIRPLGILGRYSLDSVCSVRPVFFLTSSVKYISGSGTASDPFIIS